MHGRHRDVRGVHCGLDRNQARLENLSGEFSDGFCGRQARQSLKRRSDEPGRALSDTRDGVVELHRS